MGCYLSCFKRRQDESDEESDDNTEDDTSPLLCHRANNVNENPEAPAAEGDGAASTTSPNKVAPAAEGDGAASTTTPNPSESTHTKSSDEDVCPTCFEEYSEENPKIIAKCKHHYHLACIYEWKERSETCPTCRRVIDFGEA